MRARRSSRQFRPEVDGLMSRVMPTEFAPIVITPAIEAELGYGNDPVACPTVTTTGAGGVSAGLPDGVSLDFGYTTTTNL